MIIIIVIINKKPHNKKIISDSSEDKKSSACAHASLKVMNKPVKLGEDASQLAKRRGLDFKHFRVDEVIAVKRSDGRETVGLVYRIDHHSQFFICGLGALLEKRVTFAEVPAIISKLVGCYLMDAIQEEIFAAQQLIT